LTTNTQAKARELIMVNMTFTTIFTTNDLVLAEGLNIVPLKEGRGSYVTRAMGTESFLAREMVLENCELHELGIIGNLKLSHSHDGVEKPDILRKRGYQEVEQVPMGLVPGGEMGWYFVEEGRNNERVYEVPKVLINIYGVFARF
jgi:hypothetical protein